LLELELLEEVNEFKFEL